MARKLYIIMRTDLASMNPGKACAQAAHAANLFIHIWGQTIPTEICEWSREGSGFGTTIVLDGLDLNDIIDPERIPDVENMIDFDKIPYNFKQNNASQNIPIPIGVVVDPTYPVRDGGFTHYVKIPTCVYVFVDRDINPEWDQFLSTFSLLD